MRKENANQLLHEYIASKLSDPFAWGTNDCITFAKGAIEAITDLKFELPFSWSDQESALDIIRENGGLQKLVESQLGNSVNWGQCSAGDVVLAEWTTGEVLCVHDGVQLIAPGASGIRKIPFHVALVGWRIN